MAEPSPQPSGPMPDKIVTYREALLPEGTKPLAMELHVPKDTPRGTVVFFHPGGFFSGAPAQGRVFADEIKAMGFALACPEYRMQKDRGQLGKPWAGQTRKLRQAAPQEFQLAPRFIGRPAHTASEDGLAALNWVETNGEKLGLNGPLMIFGISAGGMIAANIAFLVPAFGIQRPKISAMVILSGALANVAQCDMTNGPAMLWVHGQLDHRVPIASALAVQSACQKRAAPTTFDFIDSKAHGTWLYRSNALPGRSKAARRAPFWAFFDAHCDFQEA